MAAAPQANRPVAGVLWMVATGLCFVAVTGLVKHGGQNLPAAEAAFLRYLLGLIFILPLLGRFLRFRPTPRQWRLFLFRGSAHTIGVTLWFAAMTRITVAEVTAMNYLTPVYVTLGAALFLGERLAMRRIAAVAAAFLGAVIILRPGIREVTEGHAAMLAATVFLAASYLSAKRLSGEVPAAVVVVFLSLVVTVGLLPLAAAVWRTPTAPELFWMFLVAAFATLGHYTMTRAFAVAPVTLTQPFTFLQLVWATLLGAALFGEPVDAFVVAGGLVILGSATFIAVREAMLKRNGGGPPHPAA